MTCCGEDGFHISRHEAMLLYAHVFGVKYNFDASLIHQNVKDIFRDFVPDYSSGDASYSYPGSRRIELEDGKRISVPLHRWEYYKMTMPESATNDEIVKRMNQRSSEGFMIHHIDGNTLNNDITNLYEVEKRLHKRLEDACFSKQAELMIETLKIVKERNQTNGN